MNQGARIGIAIVAIALAVGGYHWLSQKQPGKYIESVEKITIAEGQQPIAGLVYIAFTKGYFENEGLDVELQPHTSGKACLNAVLEGKADLGTVAETPLVLAALSGEETYIISTIHHADKNTAIVTRKDLGVTTPTDLKGKKIGASFGTNGEFFMDTFLIMQGILRNEVEVLNLRPEEMFDALVNGEVNAVATWNPHVINLQRELGENGIVFYGAGIYTETYNIVVMQDFLNKNPGIIKKVLRALIKAEEFIKGNPDESINIVADNIKIDKVLLSDLWDIYNFRVALNQSLLITLEDQTRWAIENKLTAATEVPDYLDYIYMGALEKVKPEAVNIIH